MTVRVPDNIMDSGDVTVIGVASWIKDRLELEMSSSVHTTVLDRTDLTVVDWEHSQVRG